MKKIYSNLDNFNSFLPNLSFFFSSNFLTQISSFIIILLFARNYSSVEFGKFTIAQTVFFLLYSISFSNIHYYLNKSLSVNFQNRRKEIASCFLITFYTSIFLYILLALFLNFLNLEKDLKYLILIINLILITEPFTIFYSEIFVRGQFKTIFNIKIYQSIIFFSLKYFVIVNQLNYIYIALCYLVEYIFFAVIIIYYYKKNGNKFSKLIFNFDEAIKLLKKIFLLPVLSLIFLISIRIDVLMIGKLIDVESSGFYSSASRLVILVLLYSTLVLQFLYPNMSRMKINSSKFNDIYQDLINFALIVGISFFIFSYIFSEYYLNLFGYNFLVAKDALLILSFNLSFSLIYNIWVHKCLLQNNFSRILSFHLCVIILNVILNFYMIDLYGIKGAAISTMVSGVISFFIININRPIEIIKILRSISFIRFILIVKKLILIMQKIFISKKNNPKT
tara:strand:+ start:559 stop:1908 length:1350 start_codon:yes stop_codon:yes gene_type:complete